MTLTRDRKTELIAGAPLFDGVDPAGIEAVAERAVEVEFAAERVIARQGEIGTGFFIVVEGRVRVVRDGATLATLGPGEFFGEMSVLDGRPRVAQVIAETPTLCLALASWDLEAVIRQEPAVAISILRALAARLRDIAETARH